MSRCSRDTSRVDIAATPRECVRWLTKPRPARARARRASHARSKGSAATSRRAQTAPTKPFPPPGIIGWAGDGRFDLVDRAAQRDVCRQLRAINIDPVALVHELAGDADVAALVAELRAARHEVLWRRIAPSHMRFWRLFDALDAMLQQHHLAWPHGACEAFIEFVEALRRPARELDLHASDTSPALPAARAAARRARPGNRTSRIKPMQAPVERSLSAIRQRFMPHLRRQVGTRIRAARQAHVRVQRQRPRPVPLTSQQISRQINRPSHELTAAFLRAFYPWFGAGTTAEHVRKSLPRLLP